MKLNAKMLLPALALPLLLAACGAASTTEGTVKFTALKTEYKDQNGNYVACDNTTLPNGITTTKTVVAAYYTKTGSVQSIGVNLRGVNSTKYDGNYNGNVTGISVSGADYKTLFYTDSSTGLLPQAINVNPSGTARVQAVTVNPANKAGSFFVRLTNNGSSQSVYTDSTSVFTTIPVYTSCISSGDLNPVEQL